MWQIVKAIFVAYGLYVAGTIVVAMLAFPAFMNMWNGFGYWHNALTWVSEIFGFKNWLEKKRHENFFREYEREQERMRRREAALSRFRG
jgi:hypothetical protein